MHRKRELLAFLDEHGLRARKRLSQNFLIDGNIIRKMVQAAQIGPGDTVLEIGPGPGAITGELLETGAHVIAVEKDEKLASLLKPHPHLKVIPEDFLDLDLSFLPKGTKVVANLPYQITTPIVTRLVPLHGQIESLTLVVQKEVAERYAIGPGSITLFLQYYAHTKMLFTISPSCFIPQPKVHSAVVQLRLHKPPPVSDEAAFLTFIRKAFSQRRKMLRNTVDQPGVADVLESLSLRPDARAEMLTLEQFISVFERLAAK